VSLSTLVLWRRRGDVVAGAVVHLTTGAPRREDLRVVRLLVPGDYVALSKTTHGDSGRIIGGEDS